MPMIPIQYSNTYHNDGDNDDDDDDDNTNVGPGAEGDEVADPWEAEEEEGLPAARDPGEPGERVRRPLTAAGPVPVLVPVPVPVTVTVTVFCQHSPLLFQSCLDRRRHLQADPVRMPGKPI